MAYPFENTYSYCQNITESFPSTDDAHAFEIMTYDQIEEQSRDQTMAFPMTLGSEHPKVAKIHLPKRRQVLFICCGLLTMLDVG